jgi:hypothetical protein
MSKLIQALLLVIVGLAVLSAAGPAVARVVEALTPLIVTAGIVTGVLRLVWWHTR